MESNKIHEDKLVKMFMTIMFIFFLCVFFLSIYTIAKIYSKNAEIEKCLERVELLHNQNNDKIFSLPETSLPF